MTEPVFEFAECRVLPLRREVLLRGRPQEIEPKPFELLTYLIRHHDRVVSKDELLDVVWKHEPVTPGVIARAVMKARSAIGDNGSQPTLIKTVHRTGYRFVGALSNSAELASAREAAPPPAATPRERRVGIALLPFDNLTGQPALDWIGLGLMSMVAKDLGSDDRLSITPTASLLAALGNLPFPRSSIERRMDDIVRLLGVRHVLHAEVASDPEGFRIDCTVGPTPLKRLSRSGPDLVPLGQQIARDVDAALFPDRMRSLDIALKSNDPLAYRALLQAFQAVGEQKWLIATGLLQLVLDIEPENLPVRLEQLSAHAALGAEDALVQGRELLQEPAVSNDAASLARVHLALGLTHHHKRAYAPAQHHLEQALEASLRCDLHDCAVTAVLTRSSIAISRLDFDTAAQQLDRARELCHVTGNQVHRLGWMLNSALLAAKSGELMRAVQLGREAVRLCEEHRLNSYFALTAVNLAHASLGLGLLHDAARHAEQSFVMSHSLAERFRTASAGDTLCLIYRELRLPREVARVAAAVAELDAVLPAAAQPYRWMAAGHLAVAEGRLDEAVPCFQAAIAQSRELGIWLQAHEAAPWLIRALVRTGRHDEATAACEAARQLPEAKEDLELMTALRHCRALHHHALGDHARACAELQAIASGGQPGMWQAYACLDAAWLLLERGDVPGARKMLRGQGAWLHEHPVGMIIDARLKFASGQYEAARVAQERYRQAVHGEVPECWRELHRIYAAAAAGDRSHGDLPVSPWLATQM
jgi:DNA-binding winged helix-turn-helix (wHTH) protein/tetratricopeptide (TPR) repeat protein